MKLRKIIASGLVLSMAVGVFAGCGSAEKDKEKKEDGKEPIVLQWWGSFPEEMGPNQVCEAFNKIDPNLQVQYTRFVNDDAGNTKLDVTLMSDSSIDIFLSLDEVQLKKRIDSGYAYPMDELFEKVGFSIEDNYEDVIEDRKIDNHYYSLPAKRMTRTILYNKDMFDEAGVPYPTANWTYNEFLDTASKLTKGEGADKVYGYMFPGYASGEPAISMLTGRIGANWMYAEDGKTSQIDTTDMKDILEKYMNRVELGIEPSYVDVTTQKMEPANMLLTGKAAMVYGDWVLRDVKNIEAYPHDFKVGFANMPLLSADQDHNYTTSYTDDMSINLKSEHPEEAMQFIKWYIEEGMDYVAPFARIPASKKYSEEKITDLIFKDTEDLFDMESAKNVYVKGTDLSVRTNFTESTEISTILTEEFDKAFAGAQPVGEALKNAQKRADEKLKEGK